MPKLYDGVERSDEEIIKHVEEYYAKAQKDEQGRFNKTISLFPNDGMKILDYGCGWGYYTVELAKKGHNVTGIDLMQNEIDICKLVWKETEQMKFLSTDIRNIESGTFDAVLSSQVIEHVHNVGNYLSEISRVIKPNGYLIVSLPNAMNPRFFLSLMNRNYENKLLQTSKFYLDNYKKQVHHINSWDPFHFTILLASAGYELIKHIGSGGIPMPNAKLLPKYVKGPLVNTKLLKNYTYTMQFLFQKVKDTEIKSID